MGAFRTAGAVGRSRLPTTLNHSLAPYAPRVVPVVLAVVTWRVWPLNTVHAAAGLDPSWKIGLHLAAVHRLVFGQDVIFTYGPLGFLTQPLTVEPTTATLSIAFSLLVWLALAFVVFASARRSFPPVAAFALTYLVLDLPTQIIDAVVLLLFFAAVRLLERDERHASGLVAVVAGIAAGAILLVKLNDGVLALVLLALALRRLAPVLIVVAVPTVVVLWVAAGNPISALPHWLAASAHVISGYSETMASEGSARGAETSWAIVLVVGGAALLLWRDRLKRPVLLLMTAVFVAAFLKEGFVRHDAHDLVFFGAFGVAVLAFEWRTRAFQLAAAALVVLVSAAVLTTPEVRIGDLVRPFASASAAVADAALVVDPPRLRRTIAADRAATREQLAVAPQLIALLRGHSVGTAPSQVAAAWAYGLDWRPTPTLQDYAAYDAYLDRMNGRRLAQHGPQRIVQEVVWPDVDRTQPLLEAPATAYARICHYRDLRTEGPWTVRERVADRCGRPKLIATRRGRAGVPIAIPRAPRAGELVYARLALQTPVPVVAAHLLLKPFHLPGIALGSVVYRLIAATAAGPLVLRLPATSELSPYLGGAVDYDRFTLFDVSPFTVRFYAAELRGEAAPLPQRPPAGRLVPGALVIGPTRVSLAPGAAQGSVDTSFDWGRTGAVSGTASAQKIAVFVDGTLAAVATVGDSAYRVTFRLRPRAVVRVFGIAGRKATELAYGAQEAWPH